MTAPNQTERDAWNGESGQPVLPQGRQRIGSRLTGPHREQQAYGAVRGEVVHEQGRERVEVLGVVDEDEERLAGVPGP